MIADFFTKPLQGNLFRLFRSVILGHEHTDSLHNHATAPSEERVEIKERTSASDEDPTGKDDSTNTALLKEIPKTICADMVKKRDGPKHE